MADYWECCSWCATPIHAPADMNEVRAFDPVGGDEIVLFACCPGHRMLLEGRYAVRMVDLR